MSDQEYLDESLRKIAKGAGIGFFGTFAGMALGYFSRMIIARWLGPSDYGLISLGFAVMTLAATLSMSGLEAGIKRHIPFYKGQGDWGKVKGTIFSALRISFSISLILTVLFFVFADWISINIFHEPRLTPVLKIFSISIPFLVLAKNFIATTVGFQDLRYRVYVNDLFQNVAKFVMIIAFLALGFGVTGAAWGWVLAVIFMPFLAFYFLEKEVFSIRNRDIEPKPTDKELLKFSFPLIFAGLAGLVMSWTDTMMLGYFSTASEVGIYNAVLPTARLLRIFLGSVGGIFMPVISELYSRNAMEDLRATYSAVTKWIFSLVFPAFLLMVLFSEWIIRILFGPEFIAGATALSILAFGFLILCIVGPTGQILQAYGKTKIILACSFIGAAINFGLNYLLIPLYGVNGAAIATGTSIATINIIHLLLVYRIGKMHPFKIIYLKPFFASILAVSIMYILTKYVVGVSIFSLFVMFIGFLGLYFFLLLIFKSFEEEDLMIMRAIDQRLGTRSDWIRKIIVKFL